MYVGRACSGVGGQEEKGTRNRQDGRKKRRKSKGEHRCDDGPVLVLVLVVLVLKSKDRRW
jgi:hypothetical protein